MTSNFLNKDQVKLQSVRFFTDSCIATKKHLARG